MAGIAKKVGRTINCPCGSWEWRELGVFQGLGVTEKFCPQCRTKYILVFRGPHLLAVRPLPGRDAGSFKEALRSAGLCAPDVKALVEVGETMAEAS